MKHLCPMSRPNRPAPAISLLEKQAMTDLIEENVSQVAVLLNVVANLKSLGDAS